MQVRSVKKRLFAWLLNTALYALTLPFRLFNTPKSTNIGNPDSFLIARLDHIGDVILSTPLYHSIKERYPNAKISVLCGSWAKEILSNNPYVDSLIDIDCPWWSYIRSDAGKTGSFTKKLCKTIREICHRRFDVFVDLRGDIRHIFLFGWIPRIPVRISYTRSGGTFLLTNAFNHEDGKHEIERNYKLFRSFEPIKRYWKTEIYTKPNITNALKNNIGFSVNLETDDFAVIFNGGRSRLRRLSNEKVAYLCNILIRDHSLKCFYVGDRDDFKDGEKIGRSIDLHDRSFLNLCDKLTLSEVRDLIKSSRIFIGSDSSVLQLSASTNTPSISLFGPVNPDQAMPIGVNKKVIYHPYPCSPCLQDTCIVTGSKCVAQCMEDITVEEVIQNVEDLLSKGKA